ncbi:MAG: hypothetical protein LQ351_005156 [Letrouitia transgressa]|nr:MAG: hypothetical protein LQ351_005156 [Letrouitia transgressa]
MGMAGPVAVGCTLGLIVFAGAGLVPGYPGASMHPGRCLSFAVSRWDFADQWIWWVGPVAASFLHGIVFRIAPPYHSTPVPDPELAKITQLLFDCDNTLVLSEELAFEACAELSNEICEKQGIPDRYTGADLMTTFVGQNFRGVVNGLQTKYGFTLSPAEVDSYVSRELGKVIETLEAKAEPCVNCTPVLQQLYDSRKYGLAVVSSSALTRVQASVRKVGQDKFFPPDHIFSAATSLPVPTTKPDPAIYLHACKVIGKDPGECVAVEDSKSGTLSAVRAGIPTIGYVGSYGGVIKQKEMAEVLKEAGVKVIMEDWTEFYDCLAKIEAL